MALNLPPRAVQPQSEADKTPPRPFLYTQEEFVEQLRARQQVFGTPGASLTWGINGSSNGVVAVGAEGEKQVGKILAEYASDNPRCFIFHSIEWPGSIGDSDHMLVCGNLVLIIDAKRWKGSRKYSVTPTGTILRGTVPFEEGKVKMKPAMSAWRKVFHESQLSASVAGVVCIAQEKVFVPYDKNWFAAPYKLVTAESLTDFLDKEIARRSSATQEKPSARLLWEIGRRVIRARDRRSEIINFDAMKKKNN